MNGIVLDLSALSWSNGFATLLLATLYGAMRIQTAEKCSTEMQLRIVEKYKVTIVKSAAYRLKQMVESENFAKADLLSLRHIYSNGYKAPLFVLDQINAHLKNGNVHNRYGIAEKLIADKFFFF